MSAGMKFPPQVEPGTGRFALSAGAQNVRESVYLILMTQQGERWLEPAFGSRIMRYTFMDASPTMLRMLSDDLRDTLLRQEPRIKEISVCIDPQPEAERLLVDIRYRTADGEQDKTAFPFYLNAEREGGWL